MNELVENVHYYINEKGLVVFTKQFLIKRGYCCGNGCLHCPYNYENVREPLKTILLERKNGNSDVIPSSVNSFPDL